MCSSWAADWQGCCDFETKEAFLYAPDDTRSLDKELDALNKAGIYADFVKTLPLSFRPAGALCFREQAQFHPLRFASAIARGLNIYEHMPMHSWEKGAAVIS